MKPANRPAAGNGGAHPIKVKRARGEGKGGDSLQIDFEPKSVEEVFSNTGGIERFDVVLSL